MNQPRLGTGAAGMGAEPAAEPQLTAAQRLAAALGWERLPELSAEERREADRQLEAAQAKARRRYRLGEET